MKNSLQYIFISLGIATSLLACNLEQEVDLELPVYESQVVVECYLESGQPFNLLLTRSFSYFEPFDTNTVQFIDEILEKGATVSIQHDGKTYLLEEGLFFNPFTQKVFNYRSAELVPESFGEKFELSIELKDGKTISGTTRMLPPVPLDSVVIEFEEPQDTLARVLTYFTDPDINAENYFRRQFHWNSLRDSVPEQDFITRDRFADEGRIVFGSAFDYPVGDTIYNTIYHITPAYFNFLESVFNAVASNGNPFGQPSTIISNVEGTANPVGIFTTLSYRRDTSIISK